MNKLIEEGQNVIYRMLTSGRTSKALWTRQTPPRYLRNRSCWFQGFDISALSPWNSLGGTRRAGVLIGRRHVLFAVHYGITKGAVVRFVDPTGRVEERVVIGVKNHPNYMSSPIVCDLQVAELDEPTSGRVRPMPILPIETIEEMPFYRDGKTRVLRGLPVVATDQEENLILLEGTFYNPECSHYHPTSTTVYKFGEFSFSTPYSLGPLALEITEPLVSGDSGSPILALWKGRLCLVTVATYPISGTSVTSEFDVLRGMGVDDLAWG